MAMALVEDQHSKHGGQRENAQGKSQDESTGARIPGRQRFKQLLRIRRQEVRFQIEFQSRGNIHRGDGGEVDGRHSDGTLLAHHRFDELRGFFGELFGANAVPSDGSEMNRHEGRGKARLGSLLCRHGPDQRFIGSEGGLVRHIQSPQHDKRLSG